MGRFSSACSPFPGRPGPCYQAGWGLTGFASPLRVGQPVLSGRPSPQLEERGRSHWVCLRLGSEKGFGLLWPCAIASPLVSLLSFPPPAWLAS